MHLEREGVFLEDTARYFEFFYNIYSIFNKRNEKKIEIKIK